VRIWIAGAGGIGCVLGGRLLEHATADVTFVDTWAEHVDAMNERGLTVDYPGETRHFTVNAFHLTALERAPRPDVVLLCVKSYQTAEVVRAVAPFLSAGAYVVSLQNAINEDAIAEIVGSERTVGAIVLFDGALIGPAHASQIRTKPLVIGELNGSVTARLETLSSLLRSSVPIVLSTNIWGEL